MTKSLSTASSLKGAKTVVITAFTCVIFFAGFFLLRSNILGEISTTFFAVIWGTSSVILMFYSLNLLAQLGSLSVLQSLLWVGIYLYLLYEVFISVFLTLDHKPL